MSPKCSALPIDSRHHHVCSDCSLACSLTPFQRIPIGVFRIAVFHANDVRGPCLDWRLKHAQLSFLQRKPGVRQGMQFLWELLEIPRYLSCDSLSLCVCASASLRHCQDWEGETFMNDSQARYRNENGEFSCLTAKITLGNSKKGLREWHTIRGI